MAFTIALSMRFLSKEYPSGTKEMYNAIGYSWFDFLHEVFPECACIMMPCSLSHCQNIIKKHTIDMLVLSGGDDIGVYPQRDEAELYLLQWAEAENIPVIGVCRGMQLINYYYGGSFIKNTAHIATKHSIIACDKSSSSMAYITNSYHQNCISSNTLPSSLRPLFVAEEDGTIEAVKHIQKPIFGIMWHPEREEICSPFDSNFFKKAGMYIGSNYE